VVSRRPMAQAEASSGRVALAAAKEHRRGSGLLNRSILKGDRLASICHLTGWYMDGASMAGNVHQLRLKSSDSEKITINLGYIDMGHIDLMVHEGFYSNRTDFIRTAIRNNATPTSSSSQQRESI
jgi:Ribbon-Helix-Helix transcriptional regulator family